MFSKDIDIKYDIILRNRIPLLINDKNWSEIFGAVDDKSIQNFAKELKNLIKVKNEKERMLLRLKSEKKHVMSKIWSLSDKINNEDCNEGIQLMGDYEKQIYGINDEIDNLTFELETMPKMIREANFNLLKATIRYFYRELKPSENKLDEVNSEIERLKEQLMNLLNEKHDYEEKISRSYSFLHGILGSKEMEKLDKNMM